MATFIYANNILTTLSAPVAAGATVFPLTSVANFPASIPAGSYLEISLVDAATKTVFEVCYATARSGGNITVLRAQEGTTAQSWSANDIVYSNITAGVMGALFGSANIKSGLVSPVTVGTPKAVAFSAGFLTNVLAVVCGVSAAAGDLGAYSCHTDTENQNGFNVTVTGGGAATVNVWYIATGN
jgi:hypothetical protein